MRGGGTEWSTRPGGRPQWASRRLVPWFLCVLVFAGCARTGGVQIGGEVPETPVRVTGSQPEHLERLAPFGGSVRIFFDRTLSERPLQGSPADAVIVSPRTGNVEVTAGRGGLEISMEGGFRAETVYRIIVLPRFRDRFDNTMASRHELIFSTGPDLEPNLLAGFISDRLTLQPAGGMRVDAIPSEGGLVHSAVSDSSGVFTFPYLESGRYTIAAYDDLNRNREPDFLERQDVAEVGLNFGDTLIVTELRLLAPDTTAAVLETVSVLDSITLRMVFDDHLDPDLPLETVQVDLTREGANAPEVVQILRRPDWNRRDADPADPPPAGADLPDQELVVVLSRPLLPDLTYVLSAAGIRNINGIGDGGGSVEFESPAEPPAPPDPAVPGDVLPDDPDIPDPADPAGPAGLTDPAGPTDPTDSPTPG